MRRALTSIVFAAAFVAGIPFTSPAAGSNWPQFLGPDRNGMSSEKGLARSWPEGGPKVLWKIRTMPGFAGPCVHGGEVFLLDRKKEAHGEQDGIRVFDFETGKDRWKYIYDAPGSFSYNGSRTTPAADDKYVFTVGPMGHFYCFSRTTHKPVWKKNLLTDFGGSRPKWAMAQSPLLHGNLVIVAPQSRSGVIACDKATGEIVWKTPPDSGISYASPALMKIGGVDQVVMLSDKGTVRGVDVSDGKVLWTYKQWTCRIPITTPVAIGDGRIFVTGEYGAGSAMFQVMGEGRDFTAKHLFKSDKVGAQMHSPMVYEEHLYANSNGNSRRDGLTCMDFNGKVKWKTGRDPNFERGAMLMADGLIYIVDGKTGFLHLVEANAKGYRELARAKMLDSRQMWAPIALVDGRLLIRDQKELKCLDVRARQP